MAVADHKQAALAGFVTKSAIAIWKATQSWPRLDQEAELEFVGKLDSALGIDREETELLLKHYTPTAYSPINPEDLERQVAGVGASRPPRYRPSAACRPGRSAETSLPPT